MLRWFAGSKPTSGTFGDDDKPILSDVHRCSRLLGLGYIGLRMVAVNHHSTRLGCHGHRLVSCRASAMPKNDERRRQTTAEKGFSKAKQESKPPLGRQPVVIIMRSQSQPFFTSQVLQARWGLAVWQVVGSFYLRPDLYLDDLLLHQLCLHATLCRGLLRWFYFPSARLCRGGFEAFFLLKWFL